ncbi:MAG: MBOAT family protein [Desulfovibrionaceae bacterium]|nr:MBOAT family protein [Desulfovibrionaceae bacterium]MBF0514240.1 MBOAT family protein [Desulfovibrionaceae bacterium]
MVFSSAIFLFYFLPLVLAFYFLTVKHVVARNVVLLLASFLFYNWGEAEYVLVMVVSCLANYFFGLWVEYAHANKPSKKPIVCAIAFNIGLLTLFKYTNFLVGNLNLLLNAAGAPALIIGKIHLPIGVSFFTFHSLSYVMDVYRRQIPAQRSLIDLALYLSLFPQLVAGPIVRYKDLAEQLRRRFVNLERFSYGVSRFIVGLGKKVLVANVVGLPADKIFAIPVDQLTPSVAWLGILCYTLQIYFDFSGYSDMAIGLAHMFGFKFLENFNYPYISKSIREFWRRWHISLSTWFRDYLYIPLGGNRVGPMRVRLNLMLVFFLCGLWHGASWSFVFWGLYHGAFLVLERTRVGKWLDNAPSALSHFYALMVIMIGWVFFRADTLPNALSYVAALAGYAKGSGLEWHINLFMTPKLALVLAAGVIGSLPVFPWLGQWRQRRVDHKFLGPALAADAIDMVVNLAVLPAILLLCAMSLASGTHNPFIYFQF